MPVLPGLSDDPANLEAIVRRTAEHGGKYVLTGGLTLADQQREYFFQVLESRFPEHVQTYRKLYPPGSYAPSGRRIALQVRAACEKYGIADRMPRPIIPGDKRTLNKQIAETLANQAYSLELNNAPGYRVWAHRKAAWAVEDLEQDIRLVYQQTGMRGLQSIPDIGAAMAKVVAEMIPPQSESSPNSPAAGGVS
jgi:hypothetical protein